MFKNLIRSFVVCSIIGITLFSGSDLVHAVSSTPQLLPFHGTLRNSLGEPQNGDFDMVFRIYTTPVGGVPVWTGTYEALGNGAVTVRNGFFSVLLGEGVGNELAIDPAYDTYYLGITVGTDTEMLPRERMGSSLYALSADLLDGIDSSQFLRNDEAAEFTTADPILFFGGVSMSDGSGVTFANDAIGGLRLKQDSFQYGTNELLIEPHGVSLNNPYVSILAPQTLMLTANVGDGNGFYDPHFAMYDTGEIRFQSQNIGNPEDRILNVLTTSGVRVPEGDLILGNGKIGVGTTPNEALDVNGAIRASSLLGGPVSLSTDALGNIIRDPSDRTLKTNIRTIDNALETLLNLRGVRYEWKDTKRYGNGTEIGFIAQELEPVLPEVVQKGGEYLSVNTKNITALIVEAMKELVGKVDAYFTRTEDLEREVRELRAEIEALRDGTRESRAPSIEDDPSESAPESKIDEALDEVPSPTTTTQDIVVPEEESELL